MEDPQIIELFFARDEQAIRETEAKFSSLCRSIAARFLPAAEDVTENCLFGHRSSVFHTVHCVFAELRDVSDITAVRIDGRDYPLKYGPRPEMRVIELPLR